MSFSSFCVELGCPLRNIRQSWSAISTTQSRAVFTVWADLVADGRYVFLPNHHEEWMDRRGARELRSHIQAAMNKRLEALGILCFARDPRVDPRQRKGYNNDTVYMLEFAEETDGLVGYVVGEVSAADAMAGKVSHRVRPVPYALDDLGVAPPGVLTPDRVHGKTSGYRRDPAVREYVLRRARGRCELCGHEEFLTALGHPYLEAHHIIALADAGPDTPQNVIALCASHHREAHYGQNAEELERKCVEKLADIAV